MKRESSDLAKIAISIILGGLSKIKCMGKWVNPGPYSFLRTCVRHDIRVSWLVLRLPDLIDHDMMKPLKVTLSRFFQGTDRFLKGNLFLSQWVEILFTYPKFVGARINGRTIMGRPLYILYVNI